jgi:hypothetical protein
MTLLASGAVALIYNPVALATLYGDEPSRMRLRRGGRRPTLRLRCGSRGARRRWCWWSTTR